MREHRSLHLPLVTRKDACKGFLDSPMEDYTHWRRGVWGGGHRAVTITEYKMMRLQ